MQRPGQRRQRQHRIARRQRRHQHSLPAPHPRRQLPPARQHRIVQMRRQINGLIRFGHGTHRISGFSTPWKIPAPIFHAMEKIAIGFPRHGKLFPHRGKSGNPHRKPVVNFRLARPEGA
jgi:hypothetical protein